MIKKNIKDKTKLYREVCHRQSLFKAPSQFDSRFFVSRVATILRVAVSGSPNEGGIEILIAHSKERMYASPKFRIIRSRLHQGQISLTMISDFSHDIFLAYGAPRKSQN